MAAESHQGTVQDYFYSYCYNKADELLKKNGVIALAEFLNSYDNLSNSEQRSWIIRSILSTLYHIKSLSNSDILVLVEKIDKDIVDRLGWSV